MAEREIRLFLDDFLNVLLMQSLLLNRWFYSYFMDGSVNWVFVFFNPGANSIFLRQFFDKKYALPYRVIDAVVYHFLR